MFRSCDWCHDKKVELLFKELPVDSSINLKVRAQVMLVRHPNKGLTNGTINVIKGFYTYREATGDESYHKKVSFVCNIPVTKEGVPISRLASQDASSTLTPVPLVKFLSPQCL